MSRSAEDIITQYHARKSVAGPVVSRMDEIRQAYNGDLVLPLPQMDKVEKAAVANLIAQGIDQMAQRISSVYADVECPSTIPGQALADKAARRRRQAILGWWDFSEIEIMDGRRARHLLAYATSPVILRPMREKGIPIWHIRNPLSTFPAATENPDSMTPGDCIFSYRLSLDYLIDRYPDHMAGLEKGQASTLDDKFDILEYVDANEHVLLVLGHEPAQADHSFYGQPARAGAPMAELERYPNRAGMCTAIVPGRITLDKPVGKFDGMIGMYQAEAKLMALELIAVERGVFPKEWLVARPGELPKVLLEADGRTGQTGVVQGGVLEAPTVNPSYMTTQTIQMLEANQRQQGGIPMEFSGESPTNVRTGKRGSDIMSAVIDFPVQEAQTTMARSKQHENEVAIAISKGYFGARSVSMYISRGKGAKGFLEYVPSKLFTISTNQVAYPHAGSDANQLTVLLGQLVGLNLISEATARKLHPLIDDPYGESEKTTAETLEKALLSAIASQVSQGTLAAPDVAQIMSFLVQDKGSLAEAVIAVHKDAQARQANAANAAPGASNPGSQPGLAPGPGGTPGGAGAPVSVNPPTASESNLSNLLQTLHSPPSAMASA